MKHAQGLTTFSVRSLFTSFSSDLRSIRSQLDHGRVLGSPEVEPAAAQVRRQLHRRPPVGVDQAEEHRLRVGIAVGQLVLRVRREDPQLRPDLAAVVDDLEGAATKDRRGFLGEGDPGPDHLEGQEGEVEDGEGDEETLVFHGWPPIGLGIRALSRVGGVGGQGVPAGSTHAAASTDGSGRDTIGAPNGGDHGEGPIPAPKPHHRRGDRRPPARRRHPDRPCPATPGPGGAGRSGGDACPSEAELAAQRAQAQSAPQP